ncbi:MAG: glycosyltransferase family 2 protein [Desulforhopalus sp.]
MKKISVIIPIYKVENYIAQCLESVINQTISEIEILCVDDKSPDNSINIVKDYATEDNRIRIFQHESNKGLGAARNTGIENAQGEYIFFLDSDDWLLEDGLQKLYESGQQYNVKIVSAPIQRYIESTGNYKNSRLKTKGEIYLTNKNFTSLDYNAFKLFHKSIFKDVDIRFPGRLIHEDVEFYWKVFTVFNHIYCLEDPVVVYRVRENSIMTSKKGEDYFVNNVELIKNIFNYLEKKKKTAIYREAFTKEYYHFYYRGTTFDAERFSQELEPFFRKKQFKLGFSMRKIRKWLFNKKFNKNERTLRLFGFFLMKTKL